MYIILGNCEKQLPTSLMGGKGVLNPFVAIENDDMCVIFGRNKKFQHTYFSIGWNFLFLLKQS